MPAAPKSPRATSSKKVNPISKPKGAVRAKSGCYTCRIRRKKCDERRIGEENGPCETCIRLKLECLGFGAKRPDWLRDTHRVAEIRDRIKAHLAAQGMIKGHAGSGSRNQVQDEILRLSDYQQGPSIDIHRPVSYNSGTSSSGSPAREDSVESDRPYLGHHRGTLSLVHPQMAQLSSVRTYGHFDPYPVSDMISSRCDSPSESYIHPYEYPEAHEIYESSYSSQETPATRSSLSLLYHAPFTIDPEPETYYDALHPRVIYNPPLPVPNFIINLSIREYVNDIVKIQYLLGDKDTLPDMIWRAVSTHAPSQEAVSLLSQLYSARQENRSLSIAQQPFDERIRSLQTMLSRAESFSADDAMTALHVVSLYLFDGGGGGWDAFLNFACSYAISVLENPIYFRHYPTALDAASAKDQFVVKTAIWFDVLASITTRKPPRLLEYIRALFKPDQSYVGSPTSCSMLTPMGCENTVVWALAETSDLSYWKRLHERQGDLSVRALVARVEKIEPYLEKPPSPVRPQATSEDWSRYLASEIFRTSTKLFLKSVESGDYPHVQEIRSCVQDGLTAISEFPRGSEERKSAIVRSTVFGSYICGSLTDNPDHLNALQLHLEQNSGHEGVGNCTNVSKLLRELWEYRSRKYPRGPVPWRKVLAERRILLV